MSPLISIASALLVCLVLAQPALGGPDGGADIPPELGPWLLHVGDDPAWAAPGLDDSDWRRVKVPGSWQAQGFGGQTGMAWYRTHIDFHGADPTKTVGVLLGRIFNADQAFFNGVPIGGEGHIGEEIVDAHSKTRAYRIPRSLVRENRDNVLAVRVKNTTQAAGIADGPVGIGGYTMLSMQARAIDSKVKVFQGMAMGLFLLIVLFSSFLYVNGLRERANVYFGLFLLVVTLATFLDSLLVYDSGLKTPAVQRSIYALYCLTPILLLLFVASVVGARLTRVEQLVIACTVALALTLALPQSTLDGFFGRGSLDQGNLLTTGTASTLVLGTLIIGRGLLAAWRGIAGGLLIAGAVSLPFVGGLLSQRSQVLPGGIDPELIGTVLMVLLVLFVVARRYFEMTQRLQALTQHLTNVQDMERQRLARDLHDTLGQNLVSFQLNLKMAAVTLQHPLLANMLDEIATSIRRLDETLRGLRSAELAEHGLDAAMRQHVARVAQTTGMRIDVDAECPRALPYKLKENLFNIFQEALNNSVKHARADQVTIKLSCRNRHVELKVLDNGCGFNAQACSNGGLGMVTMRERAHLINGHLHLASEPGQGAEVRVEVPLND